MLLNIKNNNMINTSRIDRVERQNNALFIYFGDKTHYFDFDTDQEAEAMFEHIKNCSNKN